MIEKIYRRSIGAVLGQMVAYVCAIAVGVALTGYFLGVKGAVIAAALLILLFAWLLWSDLRMKIVLTERELHIYQKKEEFHFRLNQVQFSAKSVNYDDFTLYVTTQDGERESFDISVLGAKQYEQLLEDLHLIGESSPITKLEVKKKEHTED